jgi:hypothetical protein
MGEVVELIPYEGFALAATAAEARGVRLIAELLADGDWHKWDFVVESVVRLEPALKPKTVHYLLAGMLQETQCIEERRLSPGGVRRIRIVWNQKYCKERALG